MSVSLARKSLELSTTENRKKWNAFNIRGANVKGSVQKNFAKQKSKKKNSIDEKKNAAVQVRKIREKTLNDSKINKVELNVQRLLNLSKSNIIHKKLESKLLDKVIKNKPKCDKVDTKQETAFTEEDFISFEKEYFAN